MSWDLRTIGIGSDGLGEGTSSYRNVATRSVRVTPQCQPKQSTRVWSAIRKRSHRSALVLCRGRLLRRKVSVSVTHPILQFRSACVAPLQVCAHGVGGLQGLLDAFSDRRTLQIIAGKEQPGKGALTIADGLDDVSMPEVVLR